MRILVTNDDGISSAGITLLSQALEQIGEVTVVAPKTEQSAVSRSITFRSPLRVEPSSSPVENSYSVSGTPADCIFIALHHLLDEVPDLIVSGINTGPNIGDDILYSGTVAGALEGALAGIPSIAISAGTHQDQRYDTASQWLVDFLKSEPLNLPSKTCLNVNVPSVDLKDLKGWRWTRQGHNHYGQTVLKRKDPSGRDYYWLGGDIPKGYPEEGSDVAALIEGCVSVTPLGMDLTNYKHLEGAKR